MGSTKQKIKQCSLKYFCQIIQWFILELYCTINFHTITLDSKNNYIVTINDITKLKKAHEELVLFHSQVRYLLLTIDSILIGVLSDDHITHWNRTAEKIFGIREREVVGKRIVGFNIP